MALARIQAAIVRNLHQFGRLTDQQCDHLISSPEELSGEAVENLLMQDYGVNEYQLLIAKAQAFGIAPFNARNFKPDERTFEHLDEDFCREYVVLPLGFAGHLAILAVVNPFDLSVIEKVQEMLKARVVPVLAIERDISALLKKEDQPQTPQSVGFGDVVEALDIEFAEEDVKEQDSDSSEESAPVIQLANRIIEDAYYSGGSDIHIEPQETDCRVRVRVDGVCQEKLRVPNKVAGALLARLKVMSNLDIAEKRLPQDGRIVFSRFTKKPVNIDLRVSTAPLNHGEGVVMRILDKSKSTLPLPALGFEPENLVVYRELIKRPYGMVLHCGPTGSGKSMTLYSALNEINHPGICIRTAEDPIEYTLPGLCQMQMHKTIGLTFASALRSFLRQDPDVILVGEMRDRETAHIGIEAALTGHMLFSTLHTNDAPSTISRLTDMGVEPFMISASLVCVCAQRLGRRLCKTCKQQYEPEGREAEILLRAIKWVGPIFRANRTGCPACGGKGYKGRVGIHEMMVNTEELAAAVNQEVETAELKKIAMYSGMQTLHMDTLKKVKSGITSLEHALTIVPPDQEDLDSLSEEFEMKRRLQERKERERRLEIERLRAEAEAEEETEAAALEASGQS
ncbi:MAG: GspE/PulE family protein [Opitutales bacterium]